MVTDHEKVLAALKREVAAKPSHGARDLLATIARLEGEHILEEGVPERALRLYGVVLSDDLIRPNHADPHAVWRDGTFDPPPLDEDGTQMEVATNGTNRNHPSTRDR